MNKTKSIWPQWEFVEKIGSGSYGSVFKAKKVQMGIESYSAIKVIHIKPGREEIKEYHRKGMDDISLYTFYKEKVVSVMNEIHIMETLKSANGIVKIEDSEVVELDNGIGWDIYIRMELLTSLNDYLDNHKLMVKDVVKFGLDICNALDVCEKCGIIHRDIKPANIFINSFDQFKLGDFGIAKELEKDTYLMTQIGTVNYMAPEIWVGGKKYDQTVDIYSLGLLMYYMLNGNRFPFEPKIGEMYVPSNEENALIRRLKGEEFPEPYISNEELNAILYKACAFESCNRYQTSKEMYDDLMKVYKSSGDELLNKVIDNGINYNQGVEEQQISRKNDNKFINECVNEDNDSTVLLFSNMTANQNDYDGNDESLYETNSQEKDGNINFNESSTYHFSYADRKFDAEKVSGSTTKRNQNDFKKCKDNNENVFGASNLENQDSTLVPERGRNLKKDIKITLEEAFSGCAKRISYSYFDKCKNCFKSDEQFESCSMCGGSGYMLATSKSLFGESKNIINCKKCNGVGRVVKTMYKQTITKCRVCHGKGFVRYYENLQVVIPAGMDNGQSLRIRNKGLYGSCIDDENRGDLLIAVCVKEHPVFKRKEYDLFLTKKISPQIAKKGGEIAVKTIDGMVMLKINPNTPKDTKIRLKGKGMPTLRNHNVRGDCYLTIQY